MKQKKVTISAIIFMTITSLTSFAQEDKKAADARKDVDKAEKNLSEAKSDLREAKNDSVADFQKFRQEAENKLADNEKKIAKLKSEKRKSNKKTQEKYDKDVLALEQKNNDLRKKMEGSESIETSMWSSFKKEFNHDMDELGDALKNLTKNNK